MPYNNYNYDEINRQFMGYINQKINNTKDNDNDYYHYIADEIKHYIKSNIPENYIEEETNFEKLDNIPIEEIERYLRQRKLERLF